MEMNDKHDKKDLLKFLKDIKRVLDNAEWEEVRKDSQHIIFSRG